MLLGNIHWHWLNTLLCYDISVIMSLCLGVVWHTVSNIYFCGMAISVLWQNYICSINLFICTICSLFITKYNNSMHRILSQLHHACELFVCVCANEHYSSQCGVNDILFDCYTPIIYWHRYLNPLHAWVKFRKQAWNSSFNFSLSHLDSAWKMHSNRYK